MQLLSFEQGGNITRHSLSRDLLKLTNYQIPLVLGLASISECSGVERTCGYLYILLPKDHGPNSAPIHASRTITTSTSRALGTETT